MMQGLLTFLTNQVSSTNIVTVHTNNGLGGWARFLSLICLLNKNVQLNTLSKYSKEIRNHVLQDKRIMREKLWCAYW
jgi:hypothetical protein